MKKKLIKPPENDGELFILPETKEFLSEIHEKSTVGVCHQPYFFNPGVSAKFIFLENLPLGNKKIIFHDIDKVNIEVKIPFRDGLYESTSLISEDRVLDDYPTPKEEVFQEFFSSLEEKLKNVLGEERTGAVSNFLTFRDIVFRNINKEYLKEVLAESFLQYYGIKRGYCFLTDLIRGEEFKEFFMKIYEGSDNFRQIFNEALDEYKRDYKFRFKNFPFPKLEEGELPFWVVKEGRRVRCYKDKISSDDLGKLTIFPRASTLTIFLRLHKLDFFIHGIGGANYEWVLNRVIERFFRRSVPLFLVVSGTFLIEGFKERGFPYFLFNPEKVKKRVRTLF